MSKTTKDDFEKFKVYCRKWQLRLGLTSWAVYYTHKKDEDKYASCTWSMADSIATISLSQIWDDWRPKNDREIEACALHEMLHLMFAQYCSVAEARWATQDSIDIAEHSIIRQLEDILLEEVVNK